MRRLAFLVLLAASLRGDVTLAPLFTDHAVVQRDQPLPVWGRAEPGEKVTVAFRGQSRSTTTGADGRWIVYLDGLTGTAEPAELVVTGKNTLHVADLLTGDVWLCSGQSNMEWTVAKSPNAEAEMASAQLPLIRHIKIKTQRSDQPAERIDGVWEVCTPATVGEFTAIGFFFARDLQPRLTVPIGLINSTWGGTMIEPWLSTAALASEPAFASIPSRWEQTIAGYPEKSLIYQTALDAWNLDAATAKAKGQKFTTA
jgi:sialate O-acetylesterase